MLSQPTANTRPALTAVPRSAIKTVKRRPKFQITGVWSRLLFRA